MVPPSGSISPGGVILDANGNTVLEPDGLPLKTTDGHEESIVNIAALYQDFEPGVNGADDMPVLQVRKLDTESGFAVTGDFGRLEFQVAQHGM